MFLRKIGLVDHRPLVHSFIIGVSSLTDLPLTINNLFSTISHKSGTEGQVPRPIFLGRGWDGGSGPFSHFPCREVWRKVRSLSTFHRGILSSTSSAHFRGFKALIPWDERSVLLSLFFLWDEGTVLFSHFFLQVGGKRDLSLQIISLQIIPVKIAFLQWDDFCLFNEFIAEPENQKYG